MSQGEIFVCMVLLLAPLWPLLRKGAIQGLSYAVFLCVVMPPYFRIDTPGQLPQLTLQRLLLIILCIFWWMRHFNGRRIREIPMFRHISVWAIISLVSLLGTIDYAVSIKRYLDFTLELFLFYFIVATSVEDRKDVLRLLQAAWMGMCVVAFLAVVEKYSGVNVVDRLFPGSINPEALRDVRSTYQHRILLGAGMAMAWPLALALIYHGESRRYRKVMLYLSVGMMLTACYFSMSRGPWLASVVAACVLVAGGTFRIRKYLALLGVLALIGLATHPGVVQTLTRYADATTNKDSFKGGTFQYRLELWRIAFTEIGKSPWRFLFGYGPGAGAAHQFEWELSYRGKERLITSWDNDYAYSLYQLGIAGFCATLALYFTIGLRVYRASRRASGADREVLLCICASITALLFMMSNVLIFALQLYYLFWTLTACASGLMTAESSSIEAAAEQVSEPILEEAPTVPAETPVQSSHGY